MGANTCSRPLAAVIFSAAGLWAALTAPAEAQGAGDACRLVAQSAPVWRAAEPLQRHDIRLTFVGHATFLIESPKGVTIETDYNDYVRSGVVPTIATMNHAHSTHYSLNPDPGILHILHGWGERPGEPVRHDLTVDDVHVRNVPTNIRSFRGTEFNGNSIFIFELAGLCVAHLGHLHHTLEPAHLRDIGHIDVLLAPVDGSYTLDQAGMAEVVKRLSPSVLIPMHYFNRTTLNRFVDQLRDEFEIERLSGSQIVMSRESLPATPRILILPERFTRDLDR